MVFSRDQEALEILKSGRNNYQDNRKLFMKTLIRYVGYIKQYSEETVEELTYLLKQETYNAGDIMFK